MKKSPTKISFALHLSLILDEIEDQITLDAYLVDFTRDYESYLLCTSIMDIFVDIFYLYQQGTYLCNYKLTVTSVTIIIVSIMMDENKNVLYIDLQIRYHCEKIEHIGELDHKFVNHYQLRHDLLHQ